VTDIQIALGPITPEEVAQKNLRRLEEYLCTLPTTANLCGSDVMDLLFAHLPTLTLEDLRERIYDIDTKSQARALNPSDLFWMWAEIYLRVKDTSYRKYILGHAKFARNQADMLILILNMILITKSHQGWPFSWAFNAGRNPVGWDFDSWWIGKRARLVEGDEIAMRINFYSGRAAPPGFMPWHGDPLVIHDEVHCFAHLVNRLPRFLIHPDKATGEDLKQIVKIAALPDEVLHEPN